MQGNLKYICKNARRKSKQPVFIGRNNAKLRMMEKTARWRGQEEKILPLEWQYQREKEREKIGVKIIFQLILVVLSHRKGSLILPIYLNFQPFRRNVLFISGVKYYPRMAAGEKKALVDFATFGRRSKLHARRLRYPVVFMNGSNYTSFGDVHLWSKNEKNLQIHHAHENAPLRFSASLTRRMGIENGALYHFNFDYDIKRVITVVADRMCADERRDTWKVVASW